MIPVLGSRPVAAVPGTKENEFVEQWTEVLASSRQLWLEVHRRQSNSNRMRDIPVAFEDPPTIKECLAVVNHHQSCHRANADLARRYSEKDDIPVATHFSKYSFAIAESP